MKYFFQVSRFFILFLVTNEAMALTPEEKVEEWNYLSRFSETEVNELDSITNYDIKIPLTVVALKNSQWTYDEVMQKVRSTEKIFAQCRVSFYPITLVKTVHKIGPIFNVMSIERHINIGDLDYYGAATKPIVFLGDSEKEDRRGGGSSWNLNRAGKRDLRLNSVVLYRSWAMLDSRNYYSKTTEYMGKYEVMAHELAHLLANKSHDEELGHLLSYADERTNIITDDDCLRVREFQSR